MLFDEVHKARRIFVRGHRRMVGAAKNQGLEDPANLLLDSVLGEDVDDANVVTMAHAVHDVHSVFAVGQQPPVFAAIQILPGLHPLMQNQRVPPLLRGIISGQRRGHFDPVEVGPVTLRPFYGVAHHFLAGHTMKQANHTDFVSALMSVPYLVAAFQIWLVH